MSTHPLQPCPVPNCGRLTRGGRCRRHRVALEQQRGSAAARGYDAEWASVSRAWLAAFPWCGQRQDGHFHTEHSRCAQERRVVRASVTDHIVPLRAGGARLDGANLQSLCVRCNTIKG